MSKSGESRTFQAIWTERVGDQIAFHTAMIPEPGPEDQGLSCGDVLRKNGIPLPKAAVEYRRGDHQRQRPDHPSRYDQIADDPPPRRRRRRKIVPCISTAPGIIELHRQYLETGYTIERYAEHAGVTYKQLWEYFNDSRFPSPAIRERIKSRTGIDVGDSPTRRRPRGPLPQFNDAKRPT